MSVSFNSNAPHPVVKTEEPCLCSQMAPGWSDWICGRLQSKEARETIRRHANSECNFCNGTGFETGVKSNGPNFSNVNTRALLSALGIGTELFGYVSIDKARRGIIRARNINLEKYTFDGNIVFGNPEKQENGTIAMRPLREISTGLDVNGLKDRIELFAEWVEDEIKAGATSISWG